MRWEEGVVEKVVRGRVRISMKETSFCDKCRLCSKGGRILEVPYSGELKEGERVRVSIPEGRISLLYLIVFLLPLLFLILGAVVGERIGEGKGVSFFAFLFLLIGLGVSLLLSRLETRRFISKIRIEKI